MVETSKCQWRDCEETGHRHFNVRLKQFGDANIGTVWLCHTHCQKARMTSHMDILVSAIRLIERPE